MLTLIIPFVHLMILIHKRYIIYCSIKQICAFKHVFYLLFLYFTESTCVHAFTQCNTDSQCQMGMAEFMSACVWNKQRSSTPRCDRDMCLGAIRRFYLLVRPENSHVLLFCQCEPGDYECEAVRQGLYPMCSTFDTPPPTCQDILEQCEADADCQYE